MPKKVIDKNRTYISILLFWVVVLCSFSGAGYEKVSLDKNHNPLSSNSYVSKTADLDEIISSEEISVSTSYAVLSRQLSSKKNSNGSFKVDCLINCMIPVLCVNFLISMSLSNSSFDCSHRLIMKYIHDKDGKKA